MQVDLDRAVACNGADSYWTMMNYQLGLTRARDRSLMCMEGEKHGKVDLLHGHVAR
jgi:hypothetical protein